MHNDEKKLLTLGEVARALGVTRRRIAFHALEERLPEPLWFGGIRVWREEDLPKIKATLERHSQKGRTHEE